MTITIRNQDLELPASAGLVWQHNHFECLDSYGRPEWVSTLHGLCICESYWRREAERMREIYNRMPTRQSIVYDCEIGSQKAEMRKLKTLALRHAEAFASVHREIIAEKKT